MKKKMKAILSLALAFVLTIGSVNAAGLFTKSMDKVNAEGLQEISWKDFGLTDGTTTTSQLYQYTGETLNNTSFEGDVSIPEGHGFHYGSNNGWFGMEIRVSGGELQLVGSGGVKVNESDTVVSTYSAKDYGMKTFADTRFTLKIEMCNLSEDKTLADVNIYINNICVENAIKLTVKSTLDAYKIDNKIGFANINGSGETIKHITVYDVKPELKKITWTDFKDELKNGTTVSGERGSYPNGKDSIDNLAFEGDIVLAKNGGLCYGGTNHWHGLIIQEADGKLNIGGGQFVKLDDSKSATTYQLSASDYGMESFADTRFALRIETFKLSDDEQSVQINIFINGQQVGKTMTLKSDNEQVKFKGALGFGANTLQGAGDVTLYDAKPTLTEISWKDFSYNGEKLTNKQTIQGETKTSYKGDDLNNTAFVGDIVLSSGAGFRYGAKERVQFGLTIQEKEGSLQIGGSTGVYLNGANGVKYTLAAEDYGLKSFANTRFTIRIELYDLTITEATEAEKVDVYTAKVNIFINGKQVDKEMTLSTDSSNQLFQIGKLLSFFSTSDTTLYITKPELKKVTWTDFGLTYDTKIEEDACKSYLNGDTLNETEFVGNVSIPANGGFRYAVPSTFFGLTFKESEGKLLIGGTAYIKVNGSDATVFTCEAKDYGLSTFTNKQFTVKIEIYGLNSTNTEAIANIYVNGKVVGTDISLNAAGNPQYITTFLGNGVSFGNGLGLGVTVYEASEIKPELTKLTWSDFGFSNCTVYTSTGEYNNKHHGYVNDLNNTEFSGKIIFSDNSSIMYGGKYWVGGLKIAVEDDTFKILNHFRNSVSQEYSVSSEQASNYGLLSFSGEEFELKIRMTEMTAEKATVSVYINNVQVGAEFILSSKDVNEDTWLLGNGFYISETEGGSITIPNTVAVPTDLTSLSWEEFGYTGGITTTESVKRAASHLANLNGTLFSGDVMMEGGREIRYAENADTNADTSADTSAGGVSVKVNTDGTLTASVVNNGTAVKSYTVSGVYYGVNTFINTKFNLKIAVMEENQIGVWVNDIIVGDLFATEAKNLTLGTTLYMVNANITPISSRTTVPTGLKGISFDDWSANDKVSVDGKLENGELCGKAENVESLIGTSLYEVVKFVDTEGTVGKHMFVYGGATSNGWLGIRIYLENEKMQITSYVKVGENYVSHGEFTIDPQTAGVGDSFKDTEFSWQIDTVQVGKHILLYMSFDGQLYNNAPFVFYDFADDISNEMHYTSYEGEDAAEKAPHCWTVLGPATKTLTTLYHDLDKGEYTVPTGTTKFYTKLSNGEWKETDMLTRISAKGDYKVEFNDGVSNYIQEVVCYHYQGDVDVTVLVRALKMKENQTDSSWFDYEKRLCDKNYDDKVDAGDVKTIKEMLLGTYKEETEMKISGFFSPTASLVKDETYATIKSTGVNHIIETNVSYTDDALTRYRTYQELSYAQKYGMTVTVKDGRLTAIGESNGTATADDVKRYVANYKDYQSFEGLFIIDEPKSKSYPNTQEWKNDVDHRIERYASVAQAIHEAGYKGWSNAFGGNNDLFSDKYNFDTKCYMKYGYYSYLGKLVDTYKLDFVSFTYYPFWDEYSANSGVEKAENYFTNLAMAKDIANKKNISFRNFVQAGEGFEKEPIENFTEAQFKWNANINLAFGTSALEYFPLVHPASLKNYSDDSCASGLLDGEGHLTKFGEWATRVNKQAAAVDEILLHATNEGYMSTGGYAESVATNTVKSVSMKKGLTTSETFKNTIHTSYNAATVTSDDDTYGAFTGCFKITSGEYAGKSAMYIVNYNDTATNNITVTFGFSKEVTTIYQGVKTTQTGNSYTTSLAAGDAVLVVY